MRPVVLGLALSANACAHGEMRLRTDGFAAWRSAVRYGGLCLLLGAALFHAADWAGAQLLWLGLPTVLIAHFTLNFYHYLVDGVIWKRRRSARIRRSPSAGAPAADRS